MGYSQLIAISGPITEKSNAEDLLRDPSTTLIQAAKLVGKCVIGVEDLERWQKLRVY